MTRYITALCLTIFVATFASASDSQYPRTREERRREEIGSVVGGEGLVFRPGKIRNESTKTDNNKVNKS